MALFHAAAIFLAGTLSSRAIAPSDEVLMLGGLCGWMQEASIESMWKLEDDTVFDVTNALIVTARNTYRRGASYSRSCYRQEGSVDCASFSRKSIPYKMNVSTPCPFSKEICNGAAITLDTGFIHSDRDLGLNTHAKDRISIRKKTTCVPLSAEKYSDGWVHISDDMALLYNMPPGELFKGWKLGNSLLPGDPFPMYPFYIGSSQTKFGDRPYNLGCVCLGHTVALYSQSNMFNADYHI